MSRREEMIQLQHGPAEIDIVIPAPRRINVAVSASMLYAIDRVIERERVTLTEAVRRLVGYGDFVYGIANEQDSTLVVRDPRGAEREVIVL